MPEPDPTDEERIAAVSDIAFVAGDTTRDQWERDVAMAALHAIAEEERQG